MSENKAEILDEGSIEVLKDTLENLVAELGTGQDKRSAARYVNSKRLSAEGNQEQLNALYRTNWVAAKIVDIIPDDMTREWRDFTGDIDPEVVKKITDEEDRLGLRNAFNTAHKWARLYGTSLIVMSIDDGQLPDKPLNLGAIKEGSLKHIKVVDRHRFNKSEVEPIADPLHPNYGMPEFYRFNETSVRIHHSRVIRFDAIELPFDEFRKNSYFSDSVLDRMLEALINFDTVSDGSASMVYETNVDIVKVKGLMGYLQSAEGISLLKKRFTLAGTLKSFNNMLLLDNEEEFTTKTNTFAGLKDLLNMYALFLCGGSDVPATRLLGTAASGLNATGEGDQKNYYDTIKSKQISDYKPKLDYFDIIMGANIGVSEDDMEYSFNSLFQMTPKELADTQFTNAQRDALYIDRGVVTEEIVAKDLKQDSVYTNLTDEYIEELEELGELDDFDTDTDESEPGVKPEASKGEEEETNSDKDS